MQVVCASKAKGFLRSAESDAQSHPWESAHISDHAKNAALQLCRVVNGQDIIKGKITIKQTKEFFA